MVMKLHPVERVHASLAEAAEALARLPARELAILERVARLRSRLVPGLDWTDLLQESLLRLLDGSRRWPLEVPLTVFLAGVMRSLADEHWRRRVREKELWRCKELFQVEQEQRDASIRLVASLERLFAGDRQALAMLAAIGEGWSPDEVCTRLGVSKKSYATIRRRIRRRLIRHSLEALDDV